MMDGQIPILKRRGGRLASERAGPKREPAIFGPAWCALNPGWRVLRNCFLSAAGEQYRVDFVILHQFHGVALISMTADPYGMPEIAERVARAMLEEVGFPRLFRGFLPVVFAAIDPADRDNAPSLIADAFSAAPAITVGNPNWSEWAVQAFGATAVPDQPAASQEGKRGGAGARRSGATSTGSRWIPRPAALARTAGIAVASCGGAALVAFVILQFGIGPYLVEAPRATAAFTAPNRATSDVPAAEAPRLLPESGAARYLGLDLASFRQKLPVLRRNGFPAPEPVTGNYDRAAIDRWLDHAGRTAPAGGA